MLDAKLIVVGGDAKSAEVKLKLPTVIGRGKEAGLTVPHALVSRRHTEVFEKEGRLFVKDLGSLNGTFVNNNKIEGEQPLEPNQLLTLGNITFRAVYQVKGVVAGAPDSETISFDEVKTEVVPEQKAEPPKPSTPCEPKSEAQPIADIDETIPVDSLIAKAAASKLVDNAKSVVDVKSDVKVADQNDEKPDENPDTGVAEASDEKVVFEEPKSEDDAADTDKSFVGQTGESAIDPDAFQFEEEPDPANKSVSVNALDELPDARPAMSFKGGVDLGEDAVSKPVSQIDPVEINLGEENPKSKVEEDSSLGSFLKKLPR